jgi:hypothetical protein
MNINMVVFPRCQKFRSRFCCHRVPNDAVKQQATERRRVYRFVTHITYPTHVYKSKREGERMFQGDREKESAVYMPTHVNYN